VVTVTIRLATIELDFWRLRSGEESHRSHPHKFWIPDLSARQNLRRGQSAKLIFEIEVKEAGTLVVQGERMWVVIAEKIGETYIGILDNQPACFDRSDDVYLRFGAEIPFRAEHVIDIGAPPVKYVEWQLGQAPERTWPRSG
jgi:hypothetical protein